MHVSVYKKDDKLWLDEISINNEQNVWRQGILILLNTPFALNNK